MSIRRKTTTLQSDGMTKDHRSSASSSSTTTLNSVPTTQSISERSHSNSTIYHQDQLKQSLPHDIFTITDEALSAQYTFETEIGYGNWGSIWRISTTRQATPLAIKLVHRDKTSNTTAARIKSLWTEFKILRLFKHDAHPNVLRVSSFIITPSYALLTMSFHPRSLPVKIGGHLAQRYIRGLLSGLDYLHSHRVSHNDLKPANVVLSHDDRPVLIDFGFAVAYHEDEDGKRPFWSCLTWGTPEYLSPQRAKGEWHDERLSDIWALGVTVYELVVGRTPFEVDESEEFLSKASLEVYYQRTVRGEFLGVQTVGGELRALLKMMVEPDVEKRLRSCSEALEHAYFREPSRLSRGRLGLTQSLQRIELNSGTPYEDHQVTTDQEKTPVKRLVRVPVVLAPKSVNTPSKNETPKPKRKPVPKVEIEPGRQQIKIAIDKENQVQTIGLRKARSAC